MTLTEIILRLIGAFYVFAGYIVVRAALTSRVMDQALAGISGTKPTPVENAQSLWNLGAAVLVFASGAALMLLVDIAVWLFLVSATGQAVYLFWLAPSYFDAVDPPDPRGRQQSTNAFYIYSAATALVVWASVTGRLVGWQDVPVPLLALAAGAVAALAGYAVWMYVRPLRTPAD